MSIAINMDLKLFVQRFMEFVNMTKNMEEVHDFVGKLMSQEFIQDHEAKVQFVQNMAAFMTGLKGIDDDMMLIRIFEIIHMRICPEDDDEIVAKAAGDSTLLAKLRKKNNDLVNELREWQLVMYEAGIPQILLQQTKISVDPMLAIKSLKLLNLIQKNNTEEMQQRFLDLVK